MTYSYGVSDRAAMRLQRKTASLGRDETEGVHVGASRGRRTGFDEDPESTRGRESSDQENQVSLLVGLCRIETSYKRAVFVLQPGRVISARGVGGKNDDHRPRSRGAQDRHVRGAALHREKADTRRGLH